jgi:hypothetical protein
MFASAGQAATINEDQVILNILVDGAGDGSGGTSMLVNTGINTQSLVDGGVTSYTSDAAMTSAIDAFISGASSVQFWVVGQATPTFFDTYALTNKAIGDVGQFSTNVQSFITDANFGLFGADDNGDGDLWEANIPSGDPEHFGAASIFGNGFADGFGLDTMVAMTGTVAAFTGTTQTPLGSFMLASNGEFTYSTGVSTVPVPAAVWLFGSGLLGLVGVARRKA